MDNVNENTEKNGEVTEEVTQPVEGDTVTEEGTEPPVGDEVEPLEGNDLMDEIDPDEGTEPPVGDEADTPEGTEAEAETEIDEHDAWCDVTQKSSIPALRNMGELKEKLAVHGNKHGNTFYQCMNCEGIYIDIKPDQCNCGNIVDTAFAKVILHLKGVA